MNLNSQKVPNAPRIKALLEFVHMVLSNSKLQDSAHDLDHTLRVWKTGIEIGEAEKADLEILEPALLLHDIVHPASFLGEEQKDAETAKNLLRKTKPKDHAIESAALSRKILPDFYYREEEIERIAHAIESHANSAKNPPQALEAKIVYDADCCDMLGFSGCARCALFCAKERKGAGEMAERYLLKIKGMLGSAPFYTQSAVKLGNERLTVSLDFCRELLGKEKFEGIMNRR